MTIKTHHTEMEPLQDVALFDTEEVVVGRWLGSGGFSDVYEVKALLPHDIDWEVSEPQRTARHTLATKHYAHYAVKVLQPELVCNPKHYHIAVRDIQSEAFMLSQISHTNIIKVHGCALPAGSNHERNQYFLILDRLDETMMDRLEKWKSQARRWSNPILAGILDVLDGNGHRRKHFLAERLQVGTEIATALEYLHENRIIYRDLKPGNLGFCPKTGQVILFDFGLARRLPEETFKVFNDTYKMTGKVGTYRYMANEVARGRTYNELADVYSFSMVFWQLLALEKPFKTMNKQVHNVLVTRGSERPPIDSHWPRAIPQLLKKAWSPDISDRPSMTEIIAILKGVMMELNGEKTDILRYHHCLYK